MPPGWRPADVAAQDPKPPFELQRPRFDPPTTAAQTWAAAALFAGLLGATAAFLWNAHRLALPAQLLAAAALLGGLMAVGWLCTARPQRLPEPSLDQSLEQRPR